jgi:hypothetical protein
MSKAAAVVAGVIVCMSAESATVVGLALGKVVIVPSSAFAPSLAATLRVARIRTACFQSRPITIARNAEVLCSSSFRIADHFHQFHLRMIHDFLVSNHLHSLLLLSNRSQFLETLKFFVHHVF